MPAWNGNNGTWGDSARWNGGVPNSAGAVAEFTIDNPGSALRIVSVADGATFTIGTLTIVTDTDDGWIFRGQVDATVATLRFQGAGSGPAFINVDTNGSSVATIIDSNFGMRLSFLSDVILTTMNSDTAFRINAPIVGAGDLYKFGDGTLYLAGNNSSWTGDMHLLAGRTQVSGDSVGNAGITLGNDAVLAVAGNLALGNLIQTGSDDVTGSLAATTGSTLTLSGLLISTIDLAAGFRFGNTTDLGTIVLTGTNVLLGNGGFTIGGGTVRLGSASVAANYFSNLPSTGLLQIASGALDTNGHATFLDNLDLDGGGIRSGTGVLNLTINDTTAGGNAQSGTISATAGADRIVVNAATNFNFIETSFINWTNGADTIRINGSGAANILSGSSQNDFIDGGAGADTMAGHGGNDTYIVDNAGDVVTEAAGEGFDAAYVFTSVALAAGSELEWLSTIDVGATTAINLTGSSIGQYLIGNEGANILDGKGGADFMQGFGGNDIYYVDNGADAPIEAADGGTDAVFTEISYGLANGTSIEILGTTSVAGTTAINLLGNEIANSLIGNEGANALDGAGGADTMTGYGGGDTYIVDSAGDVVVEAAGGGFDAIYTTASYTLGAGQEVEWLSAATVGSTTALNLTGNAFNNYVLGNNGANAINGGAGLDILYGYGGADTFAFTTALGANNVDTITDFVSGTDKIALDDAIFTQIGGLGALAAGAFVTGSAAADANDRIVYNSATGQLFYDADGTGAGAAILFATLQGNPVMTASDFQVI